MPGKSLHLTKIRLSSSLSVTPDEFVVHLNAQKERAKQMIETAREMCKQAQAMRKLVRPFIP